MVVSTSKMPQVKKYTIQRHFPEESIVCIQTGQDDTITMGDCKSPSSILTITKIPDHDPRSSYEAMFPGTIFTIGQSNSNKCISVVPGTSELQLKNCSEGNAFQRWITCRPGSACDVDITWSPARIIFPFNRSSNFENVGVPKQMQKFIELKDKTELSPMPTTESLPLPEITESSASNDHNSPKIIINELLYFVHNGITVMKLPDSKLISIVSSFYTTDEIQDALDTLKDNFYTVHIDPRSVSVETTVQILHWMKQISTHELDSNIVFVSERLSRIPPIFGNPSQSHTTSLDLKKLRSLRGRVDTGISSIMGRLEDLKADILSNLEKQNSSEVSNMDGLDGEVSNEKPDREEMVDAIDLRLKQNAKGRLRGRHYERG